MTIYAVDIDGTLCENAFNGNWFQYDTLKPKPDVIAKINDLYGKGNDLVILYTARFEEDRAVTESWLKIHGVKYNHLRMGKLRADVYIDSAAKRPEEL